MNRWIRYNANPDRHRTTDCTVRAISLALDESWDDVYDDLCAIGKELRLMPIDNAAWGAYLRRRGFTRHVVPDTCPDCYSVKDFCRDHPLGVFLLALDGHVVTIIDGFYYDTWDSGSKIPLYYWQQRRDA